MPSLDAWTLAVGLVVAVLAACLAVLVLLRDRRHAGVRVFSRWVLCPRRRRGAVVEITERMSTGMIVRTVRSCPLRRPRQWCGDLCVMQVATPRVRGAR